jgi:hypothetical protein
MSASAALAVAGAVEIKTALAIKAIANTLDFPVIA